MAAKRRFVEGLHTEERLIDLLCCIIEKRKTTVRYSVIRVSEADDVN